MNFTELKALIYYNRDNDTTLVLITEGDKQAKRLAMMLEVDLFSPFKEIGIEISFEHPAKRNVILLNNLRIEIAGDIKQVDNIKRTKEHKYYFIEKLN